MPPPPSVSFFASSPANTPHLRGAGTYSAGCEASVKAATFCFFLVLALSGLNYTAKLCLPAREDATPARESDACIGLKLIAALVSALVGGVGCFLVLSDGGPFLSKGFETDLICPSKTLTFK